MIDSELKVRERLETQHFSVEPGMCEPAVTVELAKKSLETSARIRLVPFGVRVNGPVIAPWP